MATDNAKSGRTTASMLAEISTSTAAELVMALRYTSAPPGLTYIPQLDDILREARGSDSSTLRRGDMVELIGPSGSGKTTFCLFLLLTRLLPSSMIVDLPSPNSHPVEVPLGGQKDQATILVPYSHRSPVVQLEKHIRSHITGHILDSLSTNLRPRTITPTLAESIDETVKDTLSRLRVIRIRPRWKDLFMALMSVLHPPSLTLDPSKENTEKLDLLIIDGFSDGFWPERWHTEDRAAERRSDSRIRGPDDVGLKDVIRVLENIRKELGAVVVLTLQALWPADNLWATHLPSPYPAPFSRERDEGPRAWPLNIQITFTGRIASHQLPADMTLIDALRTLDVNKQDANDAQAFEAVVRVPGGQGVAGTISGLKFQMMIGSRGVEIWQ